MRNLGLFVAPLVGLLPFVACSAGDAVPGAGAGGSGGPAAGGGINLGTGGGGIEIPPGENSYGIRTGVILTPECEADCEDFPEEPIVEGVTPEQIAALDGTPSGAGPCVSEPASGSVFPAGWTRPRFNFAGGGAVHRITLSAPRERHTLRVYTNKIPYILPKEIWEGMSRSIYNEDITYTVRTSDGSGAPTETTGTFQIAPAAAGGSMVFWGSTGTDAGPATNALYGFAVGDEGVISALTPGDYQGVALQDNASLRSEFADTPGQSVCVGCHASTPDGKAVATVDHWEWNVRVGGIEAATRGAAPDYMTAAGAAIVSMTWLGAPTFSIGDWSTGRRRMVTTWSKRDISADPGSAWRTHDGSVPHDANPAWPTELLWIDLAAPGEVPVDIRTATAETYENADQGLQRAVAGLRGTGWEMIPRTGDTNHAVMPDWSHDGTRIVYTSTDAAQDGRIGLAKSVDLFSVPFGDGAGGAATPVDGAATEAEFEYYPDYSPDDALLAFNRVPAYDTGSNKQDAFDHVYYRPNSDIYVIPASGGEPVRLVSNDGVCGESTGTLYNSWAKWAPTSATDGQTSYYFLIFSTARNSPFAINRGNMRTSPASQLYMTTIVKNADGTITSSPAIYLWNQRNLIEGPADAPTVTELLTNNVTPAWDEFKIPPVPPIVIK